MSIDNSARRPSNAGTSPKRSPAGSQATAETAPAEPAPTTRDWERRERRERPWLRIHLRQRLTLIREKVIEEHHQRRHRRQEGFHWYEREWGSRLWARQLGISSRTLITTALVVLASFFVFVIAARAASRATVPALPRASQNANPIIIAQATSTSTLVSAGPAYSVGVWVSTMSPPSAGSIQVYVSVTSNAPSANMAIKNVPVQVSASVGVARSNQPRGNGGNVSTTDANGLATFTLFYNASPGSPIYLFATTTIAGKQYNSTTVFVPR